MPTAYLAGMFDVTDAATFHRSMAERRRILTRKHPEAQVLISSGAAEPIEGEWPDKRHILVERWPSKEVARKSLPDPVLQVSEQARRAASCGTVALSKGIGVEGRMISSTEAHPDAVLPPTYQFVRISIYDFPRFAEYSAPPPGGHGHVLAQYGSVCFAVSFADPEGPEMLEGSLPPTDGLVVHRYPSRETAKRMYALDDYAPWKALRLSSAKTDLVLVEGLA